MNYSIAVITLVGGLDRVSSFLLPKPTKFLQLSLAYDKQQQLDGENISIHHQNHYVRGDKTNTESVISPSYSDFLAKGIFQKDIAPNDNYDHDQQWWQDNEEEYKLSDSQLSDILSFGNPVNNERNNKINYDLTNTISPIPFSATRVEPFDIDDEFNDEYFGGGARSSSFTAPPNSMFSNRDAKESSTTLRMSSMTDTEAVQTNTNEDKSSMDDEDDEDKEPSLGDGSTLTERMFSKIPTENQAGGAGGSSTLMAFKRVEENWERLKAFQPFHYDKNLLQWNQDGNGPPPQFVSTDGAFGNPMCWEKLRNSAGKKMDFDVVVCGGTLGIFFAMYLQLQGHSVCVIEAGELRGREQEWNISMDELIELLELGILTQEDIDSVITTEFPACRSGFKNKEISPLEGGYFQNGEVGFECFTPDVLNLGVTPVLLLERVSNRFRDIGGVIREKTRLSGVCVSELVGSAIDLGDQEPITARLVLDCMGNASPISAQQRYGKKADGICCVVGSCAGGYEKETNLYGDIIYTNQPIVTRKGRGSNQYFWEAFPVGIGRGKEPGTSDVKTTYMFTYMDANENRPSLLQIFEDYWSLLPTYQTSIRNPETDLDIKRILFAYFPTYRDSPLKPEFSRVLAVGDASGIQSPLSFGGFGALTRHLERAGGAISESLDTDCLHKDDLGLINDYQPNLSAAWMFQKAMSVKMGQTVDPTFMNRLLATNFQVMDDMGSKTMKPFLQDVVRFDGLVGSLARSFVADPTFMPQIVSTVGIVELVKWIGHLGNMGKYSILDFAATPVVMKIVDKFVTDPRERFKWRRRVESWKFGSGGDYKFSIEDKEEK